METSVTARQVAGGFWTVRGKALLVLKIERGTSH
jgi:hypothetical protein